MTAEQFAALVQRVEVLEKTQAEQAQKIEALPEAIVSACETVVKMKAEGILLSGLKDLSLDIITLPYQAGRYVVLGIRDLFKSGKKPSPIVTEATAPKAEPA